MDFGIAIEKMKQGRLSVHCPSWRRTGHLPEVRVWDGACRFEQ